jgi:hypothetical protein
MSVIFCQFILALVTKYEFFAKVRLYVAGHGLIKQKGFAF